MSRVAPSLSNLPPGHAHATLRPKRIVCGCATAKGGRKYQEDRFVCIRDFNQFLPQNSKGRQDGVNRSYFAVFDGHGGDRCSEYLKTNLYKVLAMQQCLIEDPKQAIIDAWETADRNFLKYAKGLHAKFEGRMFPRDGSTASIIYICGDKMCVANSGDSPILTVHHTNEIIIEMVSADHSTDNESECSRIRKAGARVKPQQVVLRTKRGQFPCCCIMKKQMLTGKVHALDLFFYNYCDPSLFFNFASLGPCLSRRSAHHKK